MLEIPVHRKYMIDILEGLCESKYGHYLGFKGGTLAYFLYGLDRFSTDLDFDIIKKVEDEELFMNGLENIISKFGNIKDQYNKKFTYFFLLDYGQGDMNIKIEINKRLWESDLFSVRNIFGVSVNCMSIESSFANKLIAIKERKTLVSRDLYDIHFFLRENTSINHNLIKERSGQNTISYLEDLKIFIKSNFNEKNILAGIGEVLDNKQKDFVKTKMIDKTIGLIDFRIFELRKNQS